MNEHLLPVVPFMFGPRSESHWRGTLAVRWFAWSMLHDD